jgi:threonine dehydratase
VIALQEIEAAQRRIHDQAARTPAERAHVIAEDAGALATTAALNGDAGNWEGRVHRVRGEHQARQAG